MQLCGGDLPSVQEVKQRERERSRAQQTYKMTRKTRAGPCTETKQCSCLYICACMNDVGIVSLLVLCSIYNSGGHFL